MMLVDSCNGFNNLNRLVMLWTVRHRCLAWSRFPLNCYKNPYHILLRRPGRPQFTLLSIEGLTQRDPLLMVLHSITLVPLAENLEAEIPEILTPFYLDDV